MKFAVWSGSVRMVGRRLNVRFPKSNVKRGKIILAIDALDVKDFPETPYEKIFAVARWPRRLFCPRLRNESRIQRGIRSVVPPSFQHFAARGSRHGLDTLHRWNVIAINATGLDHTPVAPGENRVFGEQLGPGRASRAWQLSTSRCSTRLMRWSAVIPVNGTQAGPAELSGCGDQPGRARQP